jgi:sec-independent protein translocase protein TatA
MFRSFGWPEALIILTVVLIVFGVGKLPQVGGALGKGIREFRRGKSGLLDALNEEEEEKEEEEEEEEEKPKSKKKAAKK